MLLSRCGPCHAIAPTFEALSKRYKNVNFLKCDVDSAKDVASRYAVAAMWLTISVYAFLGFTADYHSTRPTFIFLKGGVKVDQVKGANKAWVYTLALQRYAIFTSSMKCSWRCCPPTFRRYIIKCFLWQRPDFRWCSRSCWCDRHQEHGQSSHSPSHKSWPTGQGTAGTSRSLPTILVPQLEILWTNWGLYICCVLGFNISRHNAVIQNVDEGYTYNA